MILEKWVSISFRLYADGIIVPGTADRLRKLAKEKRLIPGGTIYLNSAGGSLIEGMRLGKSIRDLGLEIYIGDIKTVSYCFSSCTLAYLGEVYRSMDDKAIYGVHRFYSENGISHDSDLETAQILSGDIVDYIRSMGADPTLFELMTIKGRNDVTIIPKAVLEKLNVVNNGISQRKWEITALPGIVYLKGTLTNRRGTHKLIFPCHNGHIDFMGIVENPDPVSVVAVIAKEDFLVDNREIPISPFQQPVANKSDIDVTITNLSQTMQRILASVHKIGIQFTFRNSPLGEFAEIDKDQNDIDMMTNFFSSCHP